ncbi:MAG: acylphosphatase [Phycisphaerales bacterium]|nr:MAG: acylphosphatase [Phycisphaerales bacterium]
MEPVSQNSPGPIRRRVHFSGRVQGVGFRFTTEDIASRFQVTGFVRNLRDGRVELVAEGIEAELDRFQDAIQDALRGYITEANASDSSAVGEFTSFRIAF